MKVVYDISRLGEGHNSRIHRTGIFRVVESIAYGLSASPECDLTFCASETVQISYQVLDYLKYNSNLEGTPFSYSKFGYELYTGLNKLNNQLDKASPFEKITLKAQIKFLNNLKYKLVLPYYSHLEFPNFLAKADIFHSSFYAIPKQAKQANKVKKFITIYDMIPVLYPQYFELGVDKWFTKILNSLDADSWVICISHATKNDLCNFLKNIDRSKIFVTHLAASNFFYTCHDREKIAATRTKYNIPPDIPYILSLNTLEPRKNIAHLIQCFRRLVQQEKIKDLCLVLAGAKGWLYDKLFEEIYSSEELRNRIIVTGYVADEDLAALYSTALAFVYPSLYEGFGLPPLEAMQCGVPVITSNTSSLPEVIGDAGIMVDPTDTDALCHSIFNVYSKTSLREAMSVNSLKRANLFSWEKCTQETLAAYKVALNS